MLLDIQIIICFAVAMSICGNIFQLMQALTHPSYERNLIIDAIRVRDVFVTIPAWRLALNGFGSLYIFAEGIFDFGSPVISWGACTAFWIIALLFKIDKK